jgi:CheY-like chemotaxis protein
LSENKFHLLITDDEPEILDLLSLNLRKSVDKIFKASSGVKGLEVLANERIDLVLSDISVPEMAGIEFLKNLRERG